MSQDVRKLGCRIAQVPLYNFFFFFFVFRFQTDIMLSIVGVAKAFDDVLEPNPVLVELCKEYFGTAALNSSKMKFALVCCKYIETLYWLHRILFSKA